MKRQEKYLCSFQRTEQVKLIFPAIKLEMLIKYETF